MFSSSPLQNLAMWPLICAAVIAVFLFLILRALLRNGRANKNRTLVAFFAYCCLGTWLSSCSEHDKLSDPRPTKSATHNDVALPEVVVIGYREQITYVQVPQLTYGGGYAGSGEPVGGGGGGSTGGGSGSGGGGRNDDGTPRDTSPPLFDPNAETPPAADTQYLQAITSKINGVQNLRVIADIRDGHVASATAYVSGMTVGQVFTQDGFSYINTTSNGVYVFQVAWHVSYQLFVEGIGTVRVGAPFISTINYDSWSGESTVKTVSFP